MEILEQIKTLDKKDQVEICLEFLIELSQNWYNAKELCKVYCTEQTCGAAERYRLQVNELKQRILELNNLSNMQILCISCNSKKGSKIL